MPNDTLKQVTPEAYWAVGYTELGPCPHCKMPLARRKNPGGSDLLPIRHLHTGQMSCSISAEDIDD